MKTFRTTLRTGSLRFPILSDDNTVTVIEAVCLGTFRDLTAIDDAECLLWVIPSHLPDPDFEYVGPRVSGKGPMKHFVAQPRGEA